MNLGSCRSNPPHAYAMPVRALCSRPCERAAGAIACGPCCAVVARPKPSDKKSSGVADNAPSPSKAIAPWMVQPSSPPHSAMVRCSNVAALPDLSDETVNTGRMAVLCCAGGAAVRGQRQRSHESQRFQSGRGPCALRLRHRAALAATYSTHAPSRAVTSSLLGSAGKTVRRFALRPVTVAVATQGTQGLLVGSQNLDRHALTACGLEHTSFQRVHHDEESLKTACAGPCLPTQLYPGPIYLPLACFHRPQSQS